MQHSTPSSARMPGPGDIGAEPDIDPDDESSTVLPLGDSEVDVHYRVTGDCTSSVTGATIWYASRAEYGIADRACFSEKQIAHWQQEIDSDLRAERDAALEDAQEVAHV